MKIEYCQKCDRGIKAGEEKTYIKDGQILCEQCYLRATKQENERAASEKVYDKSQDELEANSLKKQRKSKKNKNRETAIAGAILVAILVLLVISEYPSYNEVGTSTDYRVENVRVDKRVSNAWGVCGLVRNLKHHSVKGYVDIEFLDSSGKSYLRTSAMVKQPDHPVILKMDWIEPGQVGVFEYWTDPKAFTGVSDFKIIFRESR